MIIKGKDLLGIEQLSVEEISSILDYGEKMWKVNALRLCFTKTVRGQGYPFKMPLCLSEPKLQLWKKRAAV